MAEECVEMFQPECFVVRSGVNVEVGRACLVPLLRPGRRIMGFAAFLLLNCRFSCKMDFGKEDMSCLIKEARVDETDDELKEGSSQVPEWRLKSAPFGTDVHLPLKVTNVLSTTCASILSDGGEMPQ